LAVLAAFGTIGGALFGFDVRYGNIHGHGRRPN
jgi:hypothetical protein